MIMNLLNKLLKRIYVVRERLRIGMGKCGDGFECVIVQQIENTSKSVKCHI